MAPRFPRRRRDADDEQPEPPRNPDNVDLAAEEHAWWAQRELDQPWSMDTADVAVDEGADPPRDVLAEHLGEDWRSQFGLDASTPRPEAAPGAPRGANTGAPAQPDEPWVPFDFAAAKLPEAPLPDPEVPPPDLEPEPEIDTSDPYAVLGVDHAASWEEIVTAHRSEARRHHPDRFFGRPSAEVERAERRIRDLNVAYQELRIRRGK